MEKHFPSAAFLLFIVYITSLLYQIHNILMNESMSCSDTFPSELVRFTDIQRSQSWLPEISHQFLPHTDWNRIMRLSVLLQL